MTAPSESTQPAARPRARSANIAFGLGIAAPLAPVVGIALIQIGLLPPMGGFLLFQVGILCGLLALVIGIFAFFRTRGGVPGRDRAWMATGLGLLMIFVVVVSALPGAGVPPINDISTDLESPPPFAAVEPGHANEGRDMSYPDDWVPLVRNAYGDLAPIRIGVSRDEAFALALAQAEALGWEVTRSDPSSGTFEAEDTTALFAFVDDVSVRVRAEGEGRSVIDVRSKSRDGRGDLGTNAERIRSFAGAVFEDIGSEGVATR